MSKSKCFGLYWEGIESCPDCYEKCDSPKECLAKFATETLPKFQRNLKEAATIHNLAAVTGVKAEAILLAIDYQQQTTKSESAGDPKVPVDDKEECEVPRKKPPKKKAAPKKKETATKKKVAPATKTAQPKDTKKKPPMKAAPRKKAPPKSKGATPVNPPKAGAALHVAVPANRQGGKPANRAKGRAGSKKPKPWSKEHNLARFKRERIRNPLVRALPEGYALEKEYPYKSKKIHRVIVHKDRYTYRSKDYPTLAAVIPAIAGMQAYPKQARRDGSRPEGTKQSVAWSVTKFFSLDKLMLTRMEERAGLGRSRKGKRSNKKLLKGPPKQGPKKIK